MMMDFFHEKHSDERMISQSKIEKFLEFNKDPQIFLHLPTFKRTNMTLPQISGSKSYLFITRPKPHSYDVEVFMHLCL